jgi:hypothetical protein
MANLRVVENRRAITAHVKKLRAVLTASASERERNRAIGFPGGTWWTDVYSFSEYNLFVCFDDLDNRYWNGFGPTVAEKPSVLPLTVEINVPRAGIDRRIGGVFVEDMVTNEVLVAHRGKIGGGRVGVGKTEFGDKYTGSWVSVMDGDREDEVATIAALNSDDLVAQIAWFVHEVDRLKTLVVTGANTGEPSPGSANQFTPEFQGASRYERTGTVEAIARHGMVVSALRQILTGLGYDAYNDRARDLYIPAARRRPAYLFEVKTATVPSSIYAAVGQLFVHGHAMDPNTVLILVLPDVPTRRFAYVLRRLGIRVVTYRWNGGRCTFPGLTRALS